MKTTKPKIDAVTLNLINKLKAIQDTVNEGAWEYIHLGDILRLQDAFAEVISYYDLKKKVVYTTMENIKVSTNSYGIVIMYVIQTQMHMTQAK